MEESARRHPLAECESCPLNVDGVAYVPSYGPLSADLVIVGEAPGFKEHVEGKPFTGPSGKLLDMVLEEHHINRDAAFVTNTVLCRPPGNENPSKAALKACWPRLKAEIEEREPKQILTLGNFASQSVLDTSVGITSLRVGPPKHSPHFPAAVVVPTVHPAFCLRNGDAFPNFVSDIEKLVETSQVAWQEPTYKVFDDDQAGLVLKQLRESDYTEIVVDIEVGIEKDTDFDHPERYQFLCIGFCYADNKAIVIGEKALKRPVVLQRLRELLEDPTKKWVAHNGKFDLAGLRQMGQASLHFDTMLASYTLDERPGVHGLKYLAVEVLGAPAYDDELKRYVGKGDSYALVPRDVLYRYNAYDVVCTWKLKEYYQARMDEQAYKLHDFLVEASNALMHLEMGGLKVDVPYLDELTDTYLEGLSELEANLKPWVDNPRSWMQVKAALLEQGIKVASTNEETLKNVRLKVAPDSETNKFISLMLEHRREQKLYGTYVKGIRKRLYQGRVFPTILLHGTTTGRTACRNPNLQNVPRESKIRRLFVPSDGNVFVQGDYAQAELRVVATLAQDQYLRDVFNAGRDLHSEVALRFFGEGFTKDQRVRAKAVVFGLAYGREAYSLAQEFKISVQEAQHYLDEFFGLIPDVVRWREEIKQKILHSQEDLVSPFGARRRFWLITNDNAKDVVKEGLAFLPQNIASNICIRALIRLRRELEGKADVRLPVHDSILVECPIEDEAEVKVQVQEVMEQAAVDHFTDWVKFAVDVTSGPSWGDL